MTKSSSEDSGSEKEPVKQLSEPEEGNINTKFNFFYVIYVNIILFATGEVSDSDPSVSSSSQEEFNDGYDDKLMGDAEDQARLAQMTEKEREQEIFKRIEQREIMKTRFEIEKKLRMAKKQELKKQKESKKKEKGIDEKPKIDRAPDPKERSKDRKKTIEEKQDKKFHAMSLLKARREEKKEREEKEKQRIEQQQQQSKDMEEEELEDDHKGANKTKLKASDIYSDDSGSSDSGEEEDVAKPMSHRRSSSSDSRDSDSDNDKK
ncbi:hypothetical protein PUN28_000904 [Cardiocondyla obscurior]|uniref:Uncharacterized protein n=1 Tax=Cardiocondyla obscurior TaxID=286306 RepID=A0AAW2H1P2_9HYME